MLFKIKNKLKFYKYKFIKFSIIFLFDDYTYDRYRLIKKKFNLKKARFKRKLLLKLGLSLNLDGQGTITLSQKSHLTTSFIWRDIVAVYDIEDKNIIFFPDQMLVIPWEEYPIDSVEFIKWIEHHSNLNKYTNNKPYKWEGY